MVLICLSLPIAIFVSHQESQEFAGFSKERISELYPNLISDCLTSEQAVGILDAERNGTLDPEKRDAVVELRSRNKFPYAWEVETKRLNGPKFLGLVSLIEAGITVFIHGS